MIDEKWQHGMLVSDYNKERQFCSYCGKRLLHDVKRFMFSAYSGYPINQKIITCPDYGKKSNNWEVHDYWWESTSRIGDKQMWDRNNA